RQVEILQTAHIDRRDLAAFGIAAKTERRAAAALAELMLNDVLVERIGTQAVGTTLQGELLAGYECQQKALAAAMRAVALDHCVELGFEFERDIAAMAAPRIFHG